MSVSSSVRSLIVLGALTTVIASATPARATDPNWTYEFSYVSPTITYGQSYTLKTRIDCYYDWDSTVSLATEYMTLRTQYGGTIDPLKASTWNWVGSKYIGDSGVSNNAITSWMECTWSVSNYQTAPTYWLTTAGVRYENTPQGTYTEHRDVAYYVSGYGYRYTNPKYIGPLTASSRPY